MSTPQPRRVAFVVQRYGPDVTGGSEFLARAIAERLVPQDQVTVFTTCARDYVTWRNELPEGAGETAGVTVLRFPTEEERDLEAFNRFAEPLYLRPTTREEEHLFLRRQGPYAPRLVEALGARQGEFDAIVYFTYLYYPTYAGLQVARERSILVPTTHDEPPLRFGIYREVFEIPRGFAFLTEPEAALVRSRFSVAGRPALVTGIGVYTPAVPRVDSFRQRHGVRGPYALYAGRIDAGKGCAEMLSFFERFRAEGRGPLDLLLIGTLAMAAPAIPGVRYLGYLAEEDKQAALAGATVVVCPSSFESLSIVLLEAFALGIPALANARSPVLKDHCLRSNAGLFYEDEEEFGEALDLLARDATLRRALGENGRAYVGHSYRWDTVLARYRSLIDAVSGRD